MGYFPDRPIRSTIYPDDLVDDNVPKEESTPVGWIEGKPAVIDDSWKEHYVPDENDSHEGFLAKDILDRGKSKRGGILKRMKLF